MTRASLDEVFAAIDRGREHAVRDLARFVRQPSISAQGIGLDQCALLTSQLLEDDGIPAEIYPVPGGPVSYTHLTLPTNREV